MLISCFLYLVIGCTAFSYSCYCTETSLKIISNVGFVHPVNAAPGLKGTIITVDAIKVLRRCLKDYFCGLTYEQSRMYCGAAL